LRVLLAPGGFMPFGPTPNGLVNLLMALALVYILFKIPFWVLGSLRGGGGRSLLGSMVRGFLAYKTFGLLGIGGRSGGGRRPGPPAGGRGDSRGGRDPGPADPYARVRATAGGQYLLPLTGVRRVRPAPTPHPSHPSRPTGPAPRRRPQGWQLRLPLGGDWPENRPVLERSGQCRLPLQVQRITPGPTLPAPGVAGATPGGGRRRGVQLELPLDPYKGIRPTRSGQYRLPLQGLRRVPPTAAPAAPPAAPPPAAKAAGPLGRQPRLPLDLPRPARPAPPPAARRRPGSGGEA